MNGLYIINNSYLKYDNYILHDSCFILLCAAYLRKDIGYLFESKIPFFLRFLKLVVRFDQNKHILSLKKFVITNHSWIFPKYFIKRMIVIRSYICSFCINICNI